MKVLLVKPSHFERNGTLVKLRKGRRIELTLPLLAALTPADIEVELVDETIQEVPFDTDSDLVGITSLTRNAPRAYALADRFRQLGKTVVLGGIHATFQPGEALVHSDAVVMGEAEEVWQKVLGDFCRGDLQATYSGTSMRTLEGIPSPRFDLLDLANYRVHIFPVQATRGCGFHCEFCAVEEFFRHRVRARPMDDVLRDIATLRAAGARRFFFVDENLSAHKKYMKELLRELVPLNVEWMGQSSIDIVNDSAFIDLAAESGCFFLEVGFETINPRNLRDSGKRFGSLEEYARAIRILSERKIIIGASMIFGFDDDDASTFLRTLEFLLEHDVPIMDSYILTPAPGTRLARRLHVEGRVTSMDWGRYGGEDVVFTPARMTADELKREYWNMRRQFYSMGRIARRILRVPLERLPVVLYVNLSNWMQINPVFQRL
jgi:radical SAM superfamily enzyme YgiQ (UPF0313 family)